MTTWVNSQFPRPDFHRQVQRHYGLQTQILTLSDPKIRGQEPKTLSKRAHNPLLKEAGLTKPAAAHPSGGPVAGGAIASPRLLPMNRWSSVTLLVGEQKRGQSENQELAASLFPACNDLRPIWGANSRCAADALRTAATPWPDWSTNASTDTHGSGRLIVSYTDK